MDASKLGNANACGNIPNNLNSQYSNSFLSSYDSSCTPWTSTQTESDFTKPWSQNSLKRSWERANSMTKCCISVPITNKDIYCGDLYDATLPKDLLNLFQPLFCKLCVSQLSSNIMAKTHYYSKNHDKKVRQWLKEYSEKTGEPLHKRATLPKPKKDEASNPKHYHCDVCDLPLTGRIHAESHYMGKNHQRALLGRKRLAGKGCYNSEGKWVRTTVAKNNPTARNGFQRAPDSSLRCQFCDITVTSIPQLEMHLQGQKHKRKLKQIEESIIQARLQNNRKEIGGEGTSGKVDLDALSSYRTPSGQFYCKTCNLSMNSEVQFTQHLKSRKHSKKLTMSNAPQSQASEEISGKQ